MFLNQILAILCCHTIFKPLKVQHENIVYGTQNKIRTDVVYTCVNMGWLGGGGEGKEWVSMK